VTLEHQSQATGRTLFDIAETVARSYLLLIKTAREAQQLPKLS
jgi:hypothetical protein